MMINLFRACLFGEEAKKSDALEAATTQTDVSGSADFTFGCVSVVEANVPPARPFGTTLGGPPARVRSAEIAPAPDEDSGPIIRTTRSLPIPVKGGRFIDEERENKDLDEFLDGLGFRHAFLSERERVEQLGERSSTQSPSMSSMIQFFKVAGTPHVAMLKEMKARHILTENAQGARVVESPPIGPQSACSDSEFVDEPLFDLDLGDVAEG